MDIIELSSLYPKVILVLVEITVVILEEVTFILVLVVMAVVFFLDKVSLVDLVYPVVEELHQQLQLQLVHLHFQHRFFFFSQQIDLVVIKP